MIRALLWHTWRLVTFRHNGWGLLNDDKDLRPLGMMVALACALAWLRWDNVGAALFMLAYMFAVAWWTMPMACGLAILSIVFDVAAMAGADSDFVGAWELMGTVALLVRHSRHWPKA
jgi:hypothetical protein